MDQWHGHKKTPFVEPSTVRRRFEAKFERGAPGDCWEWTAGKARGYGRILVWKRTTINAHALAWMLDRGYACPKGMDVRHLCHNRGCVNPAHLALGSRSDNCQDSLRDGNNTRSLTAEEEDGAAHLYRKGQTASSIGVRYGVDKKTILSALKRLNVKRRLGAPPRALSPEDEDRAEQAYLSGATMKDVGSSLGVSMSTVLLLLRRRGVVSRPRGYVSEEAI